MGVFPAVASSRVFAFLLFIVLVWIAVDVGKILPVLVPGIPAPAKAIIDPNGGAGEQARL